MHDSALAARPRDLVQDGKLITLPERVEENGKCLDQLAAALTTLELRLAPIIAPTDGDPRGELLRAIAGSESPLSSDLRGHGNALQELTDRVQSLGARVEL